MENSEKCDVDMSEEEQGENLPAKIDAIETSYSGASMLPISPEQGEQLQTCGDAGEIQVRPDGLIYLPQTFFRRRLNKVFGPGRWALIPRSEIMQRDGVVIRQYALFINGHFVAEAIGENRYHANNPTMTFATAAEGCKSDALTRCCKDLGIAGELWDPCFIATWKKEWTVKVWRTSAKNGKGAYEWRRKDMEPFWDEGNNKGKVTSQETKKTSSLPTSQPKSQFKTTWDEEKGYYTVKVNLSDGSVQVFSVTKEDGKVKCNCGKEEKGKECEHIKAITKEFGKKEKAEQKDEKNVERMPCFGCGEDTLAAFLKPGKDEELYCPLCFPKDEGNNIFQCQGCGEPVEKGKVCTECVEKALDAEPVGGLDYPELRQKEE